MNVFDLVKSGLTDMLLSTRKIGDASFTFMSIVLFFVSVYLSYFLATLIRYTFEPQPDQTVKKRSGLGSYLLLFRLLVLITGFVVGILASGLALTNLTIFMGAMGLGIGFGLQNVVSNLISGLIIAFERPFGVGDVLEVNNETCKVKEISLRATMVSGSDGAEIMIPNNTLLSENLKNLSAGNRKRFLELKIMTVQEANPVKVIDIIDGCLGNLTKGIAKEQSLVLLSEITDTGMIFMVKAMITDLADGPEIKSRLLSEIHAGFIKQGIRFPQKHSNGED
jgi:small-conductance mechanosensitive channel